MKSPRALKAAGLVLAAVVLGLMTVQGSYALWNAAAAAKLGTVQAANFSILVDGHEIGSQPLNPVFADLKPNATSFSAPVTVKNNVNATRPMTVEPVLSLDTVEGPLAPYLEVQARMVAGTQACTAATFEARQISMIAQGGTATVCFKVKLSPDTRPELLGNSAAVPVRLTVNQVPPA